MTRSPSFDLQKLVAKITGSVILWSTITLGFILLNWLFVIIYFSALWSATWGIGGIMAKLITIGIIVLLVGIFPVVYLRNVKIVAVTGALSSLRATYRQDIVSFVVGRASHVVYQQRDKMDVGTSTLRHWKQRFTDLPVLVRWLFNRLFSKVPLFTRVQKIFAEVDIQNIHSEEELHTYVMDQLRPWIEEEAPISSPMTLWIVGSVNIVVLLIIVWVI